jgi:hypothetical protein
LQPACQILGFSQENSKVPPRRQTRRLVARKADLYFVGQDPGRPILFWERGRTIRVCSNADEIDGSTRFQEPEMNPRDAE